MIINKSIYVKTQGHNDIIDISDKITREVTNSSLHNGQVTVFVAGSTAGITTIEYENGLIEDIKNMWERLIPESIRYDHNERWGDGNGYAHVRAALLGASLTIPFVNKKLTLGTWQQVVIVDFDNRARNRNIIFQIMGE